MSDDARDRYLAAYAVAAAEWPLPSATLDQPTSFGSTHLRITGTGTGSAAPLLLLHSLEGTSLAWRPVIAALAAHREVVAVDSIGTAGRSVQTAPIRGPADVANWLDQVIAGLGGGPMHLLAFSNGTSAALAEAIHGVAPVLSLTLVEPTLVRIPAGALARFVLAGALPSTGRLRRLSEWLTPGVELTESETGLVRASLRAYRSALPWPKPPTDDELRGIRTAVLLIFGLATVLADPIASVERAQLLMPRVETEIYPGLGHGVLFQAPEIVLPRIRAFLAEHDAAR
ncbi:alpha/beta fold hydrolase [Herbiconiux sp. P16]|uniref:alpha/beta fold hydrolase n=1 Tax=Herbiconiux wuyangfengii TaxID=3342794 RepID=UPI003CF14550